MIICKERDTEGIEQLKHLRALLTAHSPEITAVVPNKADVINAVLGEYNITLSKLKCTGPTVENLKSLTGPVLLLKIMNKDLIAYNLS